MKSLPPCFRVLIMCTAAMWAEAGAQNTAQPPSVPGSPPKSGHPARPPSDRQLMKECVIRERADRTGMSAAEARKKCQEELKSRKAKPPSS